MKKKSTPGSRSQQTRRTRRPRRTQPPQSVVSTTPPSSPEPEEVHTVASEETNVEPAADQKPRVATDAAQNSEEASLQEVAEQPLLPEEQEDQTPKSRPRRQIRDAGSRPEVRSRPAPKSRPSFSRRPRNQASKQRKTAVATSAQPQSFSQRFRRFFPVVAIPHGFVVALIVVFALIGVFASSMENATLPSIIAQAWLVMQLSPLRGGDITVGFLPMLPALGLAWVLVRRIRKAVAQNISLLDLGVLGAVVLGLPTLLSITAWAMLYDAAAVYAVGPPNFFAIVGITLLLNMCIVVLGIGKNLWQILFRLLRLPNWLFDALVLAVRTLVWLWVAGAAVTLISMVGHFAELREALDPYSAAGKAAVLFLALLYLPNAAMAAVGFNFGSEILVGHASISMFGVNMVALPPFPLFAALPASSSLLSNVLLVVPLTIILLQVIRGVHSYAMALAHACGVGVGLVLLVLLASGSLGVYGYTGAHLGFTALFGFLWVAILGSVWVAYIDFRQRYAQELYDETESEVAEPAADPEPEGGEDDGAEDSDADEQPEDIDGEVIAEDEEDVNTPESEKPEQ